MNEHLTSLALVASLALALGGCEPDPAPPSPAPPAPSPPALELVPPQPSPEEPAASPVANEPTEANDGNQLSAYQPPRELAAEGEEPTVPAEGGAWGLGQRQGGGLPASVGVRFEQPSYTLTQAEAAAGVTFRYRLEVSEPIPGVIPRDQTSAGPEQLAPEDLLPLSLVEGPGHRYALVDFGRGPMVRHDPRTVPVSTQDLELRWEGKSWGGPSRTNDPQGPAFPPGTYRVAIRLKGSRIGPEGEPRPYRVEWSVPLTIQP